MFPSERISTPIIDNLGRNNLSIRSGSRLLLIYNREEKGILADFGRLLADFLPRKYYFGRVWVENFDNFAEISIFVVYLHGHLKRGIFMAF